MMMTLLLAAALAAPPADADWTIVAETDAGVMAIDTASIEARGHHRLVWTRAAFLDDEGMAATIMVRTDVDCARRTSAKLRHIALEEDREVAVDRKPTPVAPGSVAEAVLETVCR